MLSLNKDFDYVRNEMDIPRLNALNEYQKKYPPANLGAQRLCRILEAFMGIEEDLPTEQQDDEDDLFADLQAFPQG